jgi:hypothetical protein
MNVDRAWTGRLVRPGRCSVFRDAGGRPPFRSPPWTLKTALEPNRPPIRGTFYERSFRALEGKKPSSRVIHAWAAHRQDSKGTRWMPWHQETKKDVDGCDKPR